MPTTVDNQKQSKAERQTLQCMEIIGGNRAAKHEFDAAGLDVWVDSRPYEGEAGGDIHYFSACGSGRVTRMAVADVSGHGPAADETARRLRQLMRKHINLLDQTRFARAVNREFTHEAESNYFATVLLMTYFAPTDHLILCNAGHPPPIWYRADRNEWAMIDMDICDPGPSIAQARVRYCMQRVSNLPLGVIEPTDYYQFAVKLEPDDLVFVYTDGLIEARNPQNQELGRQGLLAMLQDIGPRPPRELSQAVFERLDAYRGHSRPGDDETLIVLRHNAIDPPPLTVGRALRVLPRLLGLR